MTTDMSVDLDKATTYAEDLPDHTGQIDRYTAAGLAEKAAWSLEARAAKIISIGRRGILEMGQELLQAREEAQYGTWAVFLSRCGIEERTAQNYMRVAEQFGDKPEMISGLPSTALYALAAPSADPIVVQEIIAEVQRGAPAPTVAQVKERLAPAPQPADDAPHLPVDFALAQQRAKKLGLYLAMSASGRFSLTYEATHAVAGTAETWPQALAILAERERQGAALPPTQATLPIEAEQEIAVAPVLTPNPAPVPPVLTPLTPPPAAASDDQALIQSAAMLLYCRKLVALAQRDWDVSAKPHLDAGNVPVVLLDEAQAETAARMALASPPMRAQAGMLTFGATVTIESWDEESVAASDDEEI